MLSRLPALVALVCTLFAVQSALADVRVLETRFRTTDFDGRGPEWYEATVALDVSREADDSRDRDPDFLEGVTVRLQLACEARRSGGRTFEFYESETTFVALETGRRFARFYLPPEIAKRDGLRGQPHSFAVEVLRFGKVESVWRSSSLGNETAQASFSERIAKEAPANAGILRPQSETPFAILYQETTSTALSQPKQTP